MYIIPNITPYKNLICCHKKIHEIIKYEKNNWAIGQLYPNGGPDEFTYFFSIRGVTIYNYLRGNISMGEPTAYENNIKSLEEYIAWGVIREVALIDEQIALLKEYKAKDWSVGELYPDGGPDQFVVFFAERNLDISPYLRGSVDIGSPKAYNENICTLLEYRKAINELYC